MHLVIDGYGGSAGKLSDLLLIREFLTNYPDTLGMTRITEPKLKKHSGHKMENSGISAFVIIAESHISIHTFPHRQYVNIDIFSCKSFDGERAASDAKVLFELDEVETRTLERGLEWLDDNVALMETERQRFQIVD